MTNLYIVSTPYHLLISIIKTILANRVGKDIIIIYNFHIPSRTIKNAEIIFQKIYQCNHIDILLNLICLKIKLSRIPLLSRSIKLKFDKSFLKTKEIYLYNDNSFFGCLLNYLQINYNLIEDGLNVFKSSKFKKKQKKTDGRIYRLLGFSWYNHGHSKFIKSIEVNEDKDLQIHHANTIEKNRLEMFKKLSSKEINVIAKIFDYAPLKSITPGNKTLLLTQPLSEVSIVDHSTKIRIYQYLVKRYCTGTLYIKKHPAEKEDYQKIFPNAIILENQTIPFEVYQLKENFHFNRAITACSTVIDAIYCADEKISMGSEWVKNFPNNIVQ